MMNPPLSENIPINRGDPGNVKVAVRIRPLNDDEKREDDSLCISIAGDRQVVAGSDNVFTFDHVFGIETQQSTIYDQCVSELVSGKLTYPEIF